MDEIIEFSYDILDIRADDGPGQNGVTVRYTPVEAGLSVIEKFVPVPFHKFRDAVHGEEIISIKVANHSPQREWTRELTVDASGDTESIANEIAQARGLPRRPSGR